MSLSDLGRVDRFRDGINLGQVAKYGPVIGLLLLYVFFSIQSDVFLTVRNQVNVFRQVSIIGIMAIGLTFAILAAEIDLSIAQLMEFTGILIAILAVGKAIPRGFDFPQLAIPLAILVGYVVGIGFGGIAGYITSRFDVPSFMTTLAILFLADGLGLMVSGNRPVTDVPEGLIGIAGGTTAGFPNLVLLFLMLLIVAQFFLSYTRFGVYIYATGGDREAAELTGVNVRRVRLGVLMISAAFSVTAGIAMIGRLSSATPDMGTGLLLPPIAAVILGGADLFGGRGHMLGTLIGVLILGVLANGMNLMGVNAPGQLVAQGIVLMIAVIANVIGRK